MDPTPILPTVFAVLALGSVSVTPWQPSGISSPQFESHAAFDPINGDFYFVRSSPSFEGWRILVSHCGPKGWSKPGPAAFAGDGVEADPYFASPRVLYFISTRSTDGVERKDLDIWRVERDASGAWGTPVRLPEPVNSEGQEWFPRPAPDGWLYFGSNRPGGLGRTDIGARAPGRTADGWWRTSAPPSTRPASVRAPPLARRRAHDRDGLRWPLRDPPHRRRLVAQGRVPARGQRQRLRDRRGFLAERQDPAVFAGHEGARLRRVLRPARRGRRGLAPGVSRAPAC